MSTLVIDADTPDAKINMLIVRTLKQPGESNQDFMAEWKGLSDEDRADLRASVRAHPEQVGASAA